MGERNYIELVNDNIFLYSHWDTMEDLMIVVKNALNRGRERWNDRQYLNRIIFSEMIKDDILGLTGFGLGNEILDGEVVIRIDVDKKEVNGIKFLEFCN